MSNCKNHRSYIVRPPVSQLSILCKSNRWTSPNIAYSVTVIFEVLTIITIELDSSGMWCHVV
jgi:hypothetical protein